MCPHDAVEFLIFQLIIIRFFLILFLRGKSINFVFLKIRFFLNLKREIALFIYGYLSLMSVNNKFSNKIYFSYEKKQSIILGNPLAICRRSDCTDSEESAFDSSGV